MLINKKKIHLFFGNRKTLFKMNFNKRNFKLLLLYKIYKSHRSMRNISSYKIRLKMEFYQSYTINARLKMINSPTDTSHPLIKPLNFVYTCFSRLNGTKTQIYAMQKSNGRLDILFTYSASCICESFLSSRQICLVFSPLSDISILI